MTQKNRKVSSIKMVQERMKMRCTSGGRRQIVCAAWSRLVLRNRLGYKHKKKVIEKKSTKKSIWLWVILGGISILLTNLDLFSLFEEVLVRGNRRNLSQISWNCSGHMKWMRNSWSGEKMSFNPKKNQSTRKKIEEEKKNLFRRRSDAEKFTGREIHRPI